MSLLAISPTTRIRGVYVQGYLSSENPWSEGNLYIVGIQVEFNQDAAGIQLEFSWDSGGVQLGS